MRAVNESRKQRKARETPEYQALTALFRRGSVPNSTSSWERKRAKVTEIGRDVAKKGGKRLLSLVSSALPDGTREEASWKEFAYEAWHELYYD